MRKFDLKSMRPIDMAITVTAVLVIAIGAWLGYSVWAQQNMILRTAPASRAIADLVSQVRKAPNSVDARMKLAQALAVAGRDSEAADQYRTALKIQKDFTPALSGLGFLALKNKEWKTGEGYFRKVIDLLEGKNDTGSEATLETAYYYLGTALIEQKKYEDAIPNLKEAIRLRRDASDTHYLLAYAYRQIGSTVLYREELQAVLTFDPKMPEANYDYGKLLLKEGDKASAAERFRISSDAAPAKSEPRDALLALGPFSSRLAEAKKYRESDPAKALVAARIAVALEPQNAGALVLLGDLFAATGDKESAAANYKRALAVSPEDAAAKSGLERVTNGK